MPMETTSYFKKFIQYASLNILGMVGLSCYILADTYFISRGLGANGLTALNLAIPIYSFVHGTGLMLGMGGATKYSVFQAQQAHQKANKVFSNTMNLAILFILLFVLTGVFLSGTITSLLGASGTVFSMTKTYLQNILLFAPAFMMNDIFICFVRNDGNPGRSMLAMLTGSVSNIILDYIFIFPLQMGILGAVLATGLAPVISLGVLSGHLLSKQNNFHFEKGKFSPTLAAKIFSLGVPSLITEIASGIVIIIFNTIILRLQGDIGVAAYGVIANLSLVVTSIYTGIAQGMQPMASYAYGIRDRNGTKQILKYAVITALLLSCCIYALFLWQAHPIVRVFNREQNPQLQQIAVRGLKLYFTAIPFVGFNVILAMFFTATEKPFPAQTVSLSRGLFLIIPVALQLSLLIGMTGVWLSYPITESIVTLIGIILYQTSINFSSLA